MKLVLFLFVIYFSAVNSAADEKDEDDASSKLTNATADFLKSSLNESINPCKDFYKFACGGILKTSTRQKYQIPTIYKQYEKMLNASVSSNDAKPFRFLKQYYKACLKAEIDLKDNVEAVKKILKQLGGWPLLDGDDWDEASFDPKQFVYNAKKLGFFHNSIISVNPKYKALHVDYGSLGLNQWALRLGLNNTQVKQYFGLLVEMAMMFGASKENAQTEIKNALNFEIQLAKIRNDTIKYQPLPLQTVQKAYPYIPWQEFLENIIDCANNNLSTNSLIYVLRPRYLTRLQPILCSTPKKDQANYMVYRGLLEIIKTFLPSKLSASSLRLLYPYHTNYSQISRSTKCTSMITLSFQHAAILMRARNVISEATKQSTKELMTCIKSTFVSMLKHIDWMDEKTKTAATEKVSAMNATIGYPDKLISNEYINHIYSKLNASSNNFIDLMLAGQKFLQDKKFEDSANPLSRDSDLMTYLNNPNVLHIPNKNSLNIQAEFLHTPVYDINRPNYINYGSLGLFISRAITDSVGERGRMYGKNGSWKPWWTTDTTACYSKKKACFANQYLNYTDTGIKTKIYGHSYANDNILDHIASEAAYVAYTNWAQAHGEESGLSNLKYTPKQLFWISTANTFCSSARRHSVGRMWPVPYGYHYHRSYVPDKFRIIGAIRNSDNFAKDFNCPCGSPMNPEKKCKVWNNN